MVDWGLGIGKLGRGKIVGEGVVGEGAADFDVGEAGEGVAGDDEAAGEEDFLTYPLTPSLKGRGIREAPGLGTFVEVEGVMSIENVGRFGDGARFQALSDNGAIWLSEDVRWVSVLDDVGETGNVWV